MRFEYVPLAAGVVTADPRTDPEDVPATHIKTTPKTLPNTSTRPERLVLALEGTAGNTAEIQAYILDEPDFDPFDQRNSLKNGNEDRRFYAIGEPITVTVGEAIGMIEIEGTGATTVAEHLAPPPGQVYYRVTTAPAADAVLKVGFK